MTDSSKKRKPGKPYPEFPLFPHATGRWAKKIKGKFHYFGPWNDPAGALAKFERTIHDIRLGREPTDQVAKLSILDLVNHFLRHKKDLEDSGEITPRTWAEYRATAVRIVDLMGRDTDVARLTSEDFAKVRAAIAKSRGLKSLDGDIGRIRAFFNYAWKANLIDTPVKYGMAFSRPSRKALRLDSQKRPAKIFTIQELEAIYAEANPTMKAFILLGLNGGMGGTDIGLLEPRHIVDGWVVFPRPKTGVDRSFPLWPETIEAMEKSRSKHNHLPYYFTTKRGACWAKDDRDSPVSKAFRKICVAANSHRVGRGFYSLRHQFRTVADGCRDTPATNLIMGHSDSSMGSHYTEWIDPARLVRVTEFVRNWCSSMFSL